MKSKKCIALVIISILIFSLGCTGNTVNSGPEILPVDNEDISETTDVSEGELSESDNTDNDTIAESVDTEIPEPEPEPEPEPVLVKLGEEFEIMSNETEADISGIDVSELDMEEFFSSMPELQKIIMKDCGLNNDGYAALQDSHPDIKIVWNIKTRYWTIPTDSVGFSTLIGINDRRRLYNDDVKYFKYCTDMIALDLGHNCISDLSFLEYMPELRILILVENYPSDGSSRRLKDISALKYCKHLRYLEFFANDVKDISVLEDLKELEDLNFCYNPVESADALKDLPNLQKLWVYGTRIPKDELKELREIYPDCKIVTSGSGSVDQGWRSGPHYEAMRNMVKNNEIDEEYLYGIVKEPEDEPEDPEAGIEEKVDNPDSTDTDNTENPDSNDGEDGSDTTEKIDDNTD